MATTIDDHSFEVSVPKSSVTQRRIPALDTPSVLHDASVVNANQAISREHPNGSKGVPKEFEEYTVLQQHVLFWDRDNDGQIYPYDTYRGFRELGFSVVFSILAMLIININFSYPTRLAFSWFPDPFFRVYVPSIHKAKHGSDTNTYDHEGRFVPQAFENIFAKYDTDGDGALTLGDLFRLMKGQRVAVDPFGWGAAFFEWGTTWLLIEKDGKVFKEDLRQVYDGSLFWKIREQRRSSKGWHQGYGLGGDGFVGSVKVI